jgi:hypothetical protein
MIFKTIFTLIFSSLLFAACCTCRSVGNNGDDIPSKLQKKADQFVISKTGEDFFDKNIKPEYDRITKIKDGYLMVYRFSIQDKEGVEGEIRFSIDSLGNIQKDKEIAGIPDCSSNKDNCGFNISKEEAKSIAKFAGFEKGIKDLDAEFIWNAANKKYIWLIRATLTENKGTDFYRSSGKIMSIDPGSGEIIGTEDWRVN